MQYRLTESIYLRCGYSYNQNPIGESDVGFNIASPAITQHFVTVGGSLRISAHAHLSVAYVHGFRNRVSGPIQTLAGPVPGSSVTSTTALDSLMAGITVRY